MKPAAFSITDDEEVEPPEAFSGTLERTEGLSDKLEIGIEASVFLIVDDDELDVEVSLDTDTARVREGDPAVFTLMRDTTVSTLDVDVMVSTQVAEIEAPEGSPGVVFEPFPVSVRFEDGEATTRLEITSPGDEDWQAHTSVTVTVVPSLYEITQPDGSGGMVFTNLATGYKVSTAMGSATVRVEDDDLPEGMTVFLFPNSDNDQNLETALLVREDAGEVRWSVFARTDSGRRPHGATGNISNYTSMSQPFANVRRADRDGDYTHIDLNIAFEASDFSPRLLDGEEIWEAEEVIAVPILDDEEEEGVESFNGTLERTNTLDSKVRLTFNEVVVWILDDDVLGTEVLIEADAARFQEGNPAVFTLMRDTTASTLDVDVMVETRVAEVEAPAGSPGVAFDPFPTRVRFEDGEATTRLEITSPGDEDWQAHTSVTVTVVPSLYEITQPGGNGQMVFTNPATGYKVSATMGSATVRVEDDDLPDGIRLGLAEPQDRMQGRPDRASLLVGEGDGVARAHLRALTRDGRRPHGSQALEGRFSTYEGFDFLVDPAQFPRTGQATGGVDFMDVDETVSIRPADFDERVASGDGYVWEAVVLAAAIPIVDDGLDELPEVFRTTFERTLSLSALVRAGKAVIVDNWVDGLVAIIDDDHTPVITEAGPFTAPAGSTEVFGVLEAEDADGDPLEWRKSGGADSPVFTLGEATGELSFSSDTYGLTDSADGDAEYELIVVVSDGHNQASTRVVVVVMADVAFVSVEADTVRITEGGAAVFTLRRLGGELDELLTVGVSVSTQVAEVGVPPGSPGVAFGGFLDEVSFDSGATTARLLILSEDDEVWQAHTSLTVTLESGADYELSPGASSAAVLVRDDDVPAMVVGFSGTGMMVEEGVGTLSVGVVARTAGDERPHADVGIGDIRLSAVAGTAMAAPPSDYVFDPVSVPLSPSSFTRVDAGGYELALSFVVEIVDDEVAELEEEFVLTLTGEGLAQAVSIDPGSLAVVIADDDDPAVPIDAASTEVIEGSTIVFTLTRLDADLDEELTVGVSVSTRSVEAGVPGVGFGAFPDQVSFAPGAMTARLVITTVGDERWQSHVMLRVSVETGMGYGVSPGASSAVVLVLDDDVPSMSVGFSSTRMMVSEGEGPLVVELTARTAGDERPHAGVGIGDIRLSAMDGTALAASDYVFDPVSVSLSPSSFTRVDAGAYELALRFVVEIVDDDVLESEEEFVLTLAGEGLAPAVAIEPGSAAVVIADDDEVVVSVEADVVEVVEGSTAVFTLRRDSNDLSEALTVMVGVSTGTADAGAPAGSPGVAFASVFPAEVNFGSGDETARLEILTTGDGVWQAHTTVRVTVLPGSGYVVSPTMSSATVLIRDDDLPDTGLPGTGVIIGFRDDASVNVNESVGEVSVWLRAFTWDSRRPHQSLRVGVATRDIEAVEGIDYRGFSEELVFSESEFSLTGGVWRAERAVVIEIFDDRVDEPDERLGLTLERTPGLDALVSLDSVDGLVRIIDDDHAPMIGYRGPFLAPFGLTSVFAELRATDADDGEGDLRWSIAGRPGSDGGKFELSEGGGLSFLDPAGSEPDADGDGEYELFVSVSDGSNATTERITVVVVMDRNVVTVEAVSAEVSEGDTGEFALRRLGSLGEPVMVSIRVETSVAEPGAPGVEIESEFPESVTFAANAAEVRVSVRTTNDTVWQAHTGLTLEVVEVESSTSYAVLGSLSSATVLVLDDDVPSMVVGFSSIRMRVSEGEGPLVVEVVARTAGDERPHADVGIGSVRLSAMDGTALMPADYMAGVMEMVIAPSSFTRVDAGTYEAALSFVVEIVDDEVAELEEEFDLTLTGVGLAPVVSVDPGSAAVVIADDDEVVVSVAADVVEVVEGSTVVFTLRRDNDERAEALTVMLGVSTETAEVEAPPGSPGVSFGGFPGEVSFDSEATTARLTILTTGDEIWQAHTSLTVTVLPGSGYAISPTMSSATVLVRDDDVPSMVVGFSSTRMVVSEGGGPLVVELTARTSGDERPHADVGIGSVRLSAVDGTALMPADYMAGVMEMVIAPSSFTRVDVGAYEAALRFVVGTVDDEVAELEEEFVLTLTGVGLAPVVSVDPGSAEVVITDDDEAVVSIEADVVEVVEGSPAVFTLRRDNDERTEALTVMLGVSTETAEINAPANSIGVAFGGFPGEVSFNSEETTSRLAIPTMGDENWQAHTSLTVTVLPGEGYVVSPISSSAVVRVRDDDLPPMEVGFASPESLVFPESAGMITLTVYARTDYGQRPHRSFRMRLGAGDDTAFYPDDYTYPFREWGVVIRESHFMPRGDIYEALVEVPGLFIVDDDEEENSETFDMLMTRDSFLVSAVVRFDRDSDVPIEIRDNDGKVSVDAPSAAGLELTEGSSVVFTLRRSVASRHSLAVNVSVSTQVAEVGAPDDSPGVVFGTFPVEVIFSAGEATTKLVVWSANDEVWQAHTSLTVTVRDGLGYVVSPTMDSATVRVLDDDLPDTGVFIEFRDTSSHDARGEAITPREDSGEVLVWARARTQDGRRPHQGIRIRLATDNLEAVAGVDYVGINVDVDEVNMVFSESDFRLMDGVWIGDSNVAIGILDDELAEGDERFFVTLERILGLSTLVTLGQRDGYVRIIDDDHAPVITEAGPFRVPVGFTGVFGALGAEDADGDPLEWSKSGGADSPVFTLGEATGELSFSSDTYGLTDSADDDENYELSVEVSDGYNQASTLVVVVVVTDVAIVSVEADAVGITEGSAAVFTLRRMSGNVDEPLTVGVSVSTQVAEVGVPPGSPGVAFGGFLDEVRFDSGATTARLLILSEDDEAWQTHTSLTAVVKFGADYVVSPGASSAAVLVRDDDVPAMVVGFSGTGMMVEEGVGTLSVGVIARTAGDERPHADVGIGDIRLSAVAGTAMAAPPSDYVFDPVSVSLSPSSFTRVDAGAYELALSFVVEIVDDEIAELEEEFVLTLTGEGLAPAVSIDPGSLAVVIADDDDPAVPIDAASTEVIEGSTIVFTLTRMDADLDEELTVGVSVSTRSVEAGVPGVGFGAFPDQVSFAPGAMTAHLVITTVGDERWQSHVMLRVSVETGVGYGVSPGASSAVVLVLDDDVPSMSVGFSSTRMMVSEGEGPLVVELTARTAGNERPHADVGIGDIRLSAMDGTALAASDYVFDPVSVSLSPSSFTRVDAGAYEAALRFAVEIVDDEVLELEEEFVLTLTGEGLAPAVAIEPGSAAVVIADDDEAVVSIEADDVEVVEGSTAVFTLKRDSNDLSEALTVMVGVSTLVAEVEAPPGSPGVALVSVPGSVVFNRGDETARLEITTMDDDAWQAHTSLTVTVLPGAGYAPSETMGSAVVLVEDDDLPGGMVAGFRGTDISGADDSYVEVSEDAGRASVVIFARTGDGRRPHRAMRLVVASGQRDLLDREHLASVIEDYLHFFVNIAFAPSDFVFGDGAWSAETSAKITIEDDGVVEPDEAFALTLGGLSGSLGDAVSFAPADGGVLILNDDHAPVITRAGPFRAPVGSTEVFGVLEADDADGDPLRWSIAGGADSPVFTLDEATGELSFSSDTYGLTDSADGNAEYELIVKVSDGYNQASTGVMVFLVEIALVSVEADREEITEGGDAVFTLRRLGGEVGEPLTVGVSVSTQVAEVGAPVGSPGVVFGGFPGEATFSAGEATTQLALATVDTPGWQAHATVRVTVLPGSGYGVSPIASSAVVLVEDDDVPVMAVGFSSTRMRVSEGEGPLVVEVVARTAGDERPHADVGIGGVRLSAVDGTALMPADYMAGVMEMVIAPSSFTRVDAGAYEAALRFVVGIVDDEVAELEEEFVLTLTGVGLAPAVSVDPGSAEVVITDDDEVVVSIEADVVEVVEGSTAVFTLRRDNDERVEALTVMLGVSTGIAEINAPANSTGVSFGGFPGEVSFNSGATTARLAILTVGDEIWQAHTTVRVTVLPGEGYVVSPTMSSAVVLVEDNDLPDTGVSIGFRDTHINDKRGEGITPREDSGEVLVWARARTQDGRRPHQEIGIRIATEQLDSGGSGLAVEAVGDVDYVSVDADVTDTNVVFFESDFRLMDGVWIGDSNVAIEILDDELAEGDERFFVTLERSFDLSTLVTLGQVDGYVRIIDDDHAPVITEAGPFRVPVGFTGVFGVLEAEDADGDPLTWSKSGGADSPVFTLGEATGELSFSSDTYGLTDSADGDAEYELIVEVSDRYNQASTLVVVVVMTDVAIVSVEADTVRITEGGTAVFTLSRMGGEVGAPLTVGVSVSTQVAEVGVPPGSPGVAFGGFLDEVRFDSGETTARLLVSSEDDEAWQAHTSLTAVVKFGADYVVSPGASSAAVLVRDDDVPVMVVGFSDTGMMVEEGVGTLSVGVVARTAGDERPHADVGIGDIRLSAVAGTAMAMAPSDYVLGPGPVSLSPLSFTRVDAGGYELALSFVVEIVDDEIAELDEEFVLTLTGEGLAPSVSIDPGSLAVVIADDDDPAVPIDAASTEVIEGSTIVFTLTRLDADLDEGLTVGVSVSTQSVEAGVPGVGFGAFPDQVSFDPGAMTAHLVITTVGDERWQSHVMLRMSVETGMGYGVSPGASSAVVLVLDDDVPSMSVGFSSTRMMVSEGEGPLVVELTARTAGDERPHAGVGIGDIRLSAMDGTALASADYVDEVLQMPLSPPGFTRVDAGVYEATLRFVVGIVDDEVLELEEEFVLTLTGEGLAPAVAIEPGSAAVVIADDDEAVVSVEADVVEVVEGSTAVFTLRRDSNDLSEALTVMVGVSTETAEVEAPPGSPGVSFGGFPGEAIFNSGATAARLEILTTGDGVWQAHTSLTVTVLPGAGYAPSETMGSAVVRVEDDDLPDTGVFIEFRDTSSHDGRGEAIAPREDSGEVLVWARARTQDGRRPHQRIGLRLSTDTLEAVGRAVEAVDGVDYVGINVDVNQANMVFSESDFRLMDGVWIGDSNVAIEILDDELAEGDEIFFVTLERSLGLSALVTRGQVDGYVRIIDDDHAPVIGYRGPFLAPFGLTSVFAELRATDADDDEGDLRWSIAGRPGSDGGKFELSEGGGLSFLDPAGSEPDADGDGEYELFVLVSDGSNATTERITVVVVMNRNVVTVEAVSAEVSEGDTGEFALRRLGSLGEPVMVSIRVSTSVAEPGAPGVEIESEFPESVTFAANAAEVRVPVRTTNDAVWQAHTGLTLEVVEMESSTSYAVLGSLSSATVLVRDDDVPVMAVGFSSTRMRVSEGGGPLVVEVVARTAGDERPHADVGIGSVRLSAMDGTALMPADYMAGVMEMVIAPSSFTRVDAGAYEAALRFVVEIVDDEAAELEEEFDLTLTGVGLAPVVSVDPGSAEVVIADDDEVVVSVAADVVEVVEGSTVVFTLRRDNDERTEALTVMLGVSTGIAEINAPANSTGVAFASVFPAGANFGPGATTSRLAILTTGDEIWQAHTTVRVTVLPGSDYAISPTMSSATVLVRDNDLPKGIIASLDKGACHGCSPTVSRLFFDEDVGVARVYVRVTTPDDRRPHIPLSEVFQYSTQDTDIPPHGILLPDGTLIRAGDRRLPRIGLAREGDDYKPVFTQASVAVEDFERVKSGNGYVWEALTLLAEIPILDDKVAEDAESFIGTLERTMSDLYRSGVLVLGNVDSDPVIFDDDHAPVITRAGPFTALAGSTEVFGVLEAKDADGDPLEWSIAGGADSPVFTLGEATGELSFSSDTYGLGDSADGDAEYQLIVEVSDRYNQASTEVAVVVMADVAFVSVEADREEITEGGAAVFTLSRMGGEVGEPLTVGVSVLTGVAEVEAPDGSPGVGFPDPFQETVRFNVGDSTTQLEIRTLNDLFWQAHTTVRVTVLPGAGYAPSETMGSAVVLVRDNDLPSIAVSFSDPEVTVEEGVGTLSVEVVARTAGNERPHTDVGPYTDVEIGGIRLSAMDGTAMAPTDYVFDPGPVSLSPSSFTRVDAGAYEAVLRFVVEIVDDEVAELEEEFDLALTGVSLARTVSVDPSLATVVITDDDEKNLPREFSVMEILDGDRVIPSTAATRDSPYRVTEGSSVQFRLRRVGGFERTTATWTGYLSLGKRGQAIQAEEDAPESSTLVRWVHHGPQSFARPEVERGRTGRIAADGTIEVPEDDEWGAHALLEVIVLAQYSDSEGLDPGDVEGVVPSLGPPSVFLLLLDNDQPEGMVGNLRRTDGSIFDAGTDDLRSLTLVREDAGEARSTIRIRTTDKRRPHGEVGKITYDSIPLAGSAAPGTRLAEENKDYVRISEDVGFEESDFRLRRVGGKEIWEAVKPVVVPIVNDEEVEPPEVFSGTLERTAGLSDKLVLGSVNVQFLILDDDALEVEVSILAGAARVREGSPAVFTLMRDTTVSTLDVDVMVSTQVAEIEAPEGSPGVVFEPFPVSVRFEDGEATTRLEITSPGDEDWQAHTSLTVTVVSSLYEITQPGGEGKEIFTNLATGYKVSTAMGSATVRVEDDDLPEGMVGNLRRTDGSEAGSDINDLRSLTLVREDAGEARSIIVIRTADAQRPHGEVGKITYASRPPAGSAAPGTRFAEEDKDFVRVSDDVGFEESDFRLRRVGGKQIWEAVKTIVFPIVNDEEVEPPEVFRGTLERTPRLSDKLVLGADDVQFLILDDDVLEVEVSILAGAERVQEGDPAVFTLMRDTTVSTLDVDVMVSTQVAEIEAPEGSPGVVFEPFPQVRFEDGEATARLEIASPGDEDWQAHTSVTVTVVPNLYEVRQPGGDGEEIFTNPATGYRASTTMGSAEVRVEDNDLPDGIRFGLAEQTDRMPSRPDRAGLLVGEGEGVARAHFRALTRDGRRPHGSQALEGRFVTREDLASLDPVQFPRVGQATDGEDFIGVDRTVSIRPADFDERVASGDGDVWEAVVLAAEIPIVDDGLDELPEVFRTTFEETFSLVGLVRAGKVVVVGGWKNGIVAIIDDDDPGVSAVTVSAEEDSITEGSTAVFVLDAPWHRDGADGGCVDHDREGAGRRERGGEPAHRADRGSLVPR